ncbi:MAG: class I tRNA ligase family protein, partial [Bacteroidia bacterium]|nr:class I tRNA ligase family protein [Bacteroidia bacterium]
VDQTRGWFYTLHAIAAMVFDSVAFKNVVSNGLVLDKNGQKMSKRLGNAVDPFDTIEKYGADATRWYMMANANPWDNLKFDNAGIEEVKRKFFGTLYNTYSFFALYANIDGFNYSEPDVPLAERAEIDRWIISLLNTLKEEVRKEYANYEPTRAARRIQDFVESHLSNWYVRLCRRRFWKGEYTKDKVAAYQTLYTCLKTISKLMAPVSPFFADWLFRNLNNVSGSEDHESVHLSLFPVADSTAIDKDLEQRMSYAQRISSLVLSLRKKEKLRVRQPLNKILLPILDQKFEAQVHAVEDLILHEVNVKEFEYIKDASGVIKKRIKPNFKTLGKRLGRHMKTASQTIMSLNSDQIAEIEKTGMFMLQVDGEQFDLTIEDFEISAEEIPGWQVAQDGEITVALDINLTEELLAEGMARELVNRIQNARKDKNFDVTDRILVELQDHSGIKDAIGRFSDYIRNEVLADSIQLVEDGHGESISLPGDIEILMDVVKS